MVTLHLALQDAPAASKTLLLLLACIARGEEGLARGVYFFFGSNERAKEITKKKREAANGFVGCFKAKEEMLMIFLGLGKKKKKKERSLSKRDRDVQRKKAIYAL